MGGITNLTRILSLSIADWWLYRAKARNATHITSGLPCNKTHDNSSSLLLCVPCNAHLSPLLLHTITMAGESEDKPLVTLAKNAYVLLVLAPISLFIFTYERALTPLYGLGPVQQHLNKFVVAGAMLAAINPLHFKPWINWLVAGVALTIAPNATYWVAVFTGREHNSLFGVLKTHAAVALPIVFAMSGPVMRALDAVGPFPSLSLSLCGDHRG